MAGRGACPDPDPRRGLRAGRGRLAARRRHACLGPARAPAGDDDGDRGGGAAGRPGRAPVGGRSMARYGRRRVRRVPGGAASVGVDVAGRGASRGAGRDADRVAGPWEAEAAAFGTPGMPSTFEDAPNAGRPVGAEQAAAEAQSLEILARVRAVVLPRPLLLAEDRGWWSARRRMVVVDGRGAAGAAIAPLVAASWSRSTWPRGSSARYDVASGPVRACRGARTGRGSWARSPGRRWSAWRSRPRRASSWPWASPPATGGMGVASALLRSLVDGRQPGTGMRATVGVAERDWVEPHRHRTSRGTSLAACSSARASSCGAPRPTSPGTIPGPSPRASAPADRLRGASFQRQPSSGAT